MQRQVHDFHKLYGVDAPASPAMPANEVRSLRERLICEELGEFCDANSKGDLVAAIDAIGDLLYVVLGAAVAYGVDIQPFFDEIHRSNMSKAWHYKDMILVDTAVHAVTPTLQGTYIVKRTDGKVIKSPSYTPADLAGVLKRLTTPLPSAFGENRDGLLFGNDAPSKPGHAH